MMFIRNLVAFVFGVACQVLAGLFPDLTPVLAPAGTLLLGASNIAKVLNGSLWKHALTFGLGIVFQVAAIKAAWVCGLLGANPAGVPDVRGALLGAGGLLGQAADIGKLLTALRPVEPPPADDAKGKTA